jgi:hypothetical protein
MRLASKLGSYLPETLVYGSLSFLAFCDHSWIVKVCRLVRQETRRSEADIIVHEPYAIQVIAFYATGLPEEIVPAELDLFASFYLDLSSECRDETAAIVG